MNFKDTAISLKKNKILYYAKNIIRQFIPGFLYQRKLKKILTAYDETDRQYINYRLNYYNKLNTVNSINSDAISIGDLKIFKGPKAYNFDTFEYTRYFSKTLKANFLFGDIQHVPNIPSIQKSRPIWGDNDNAVLLNLDKKRHFLFVKDTTPYSAKKDMLIGRGTMSQQHRIRFMEMYFNHPMCDLGQINQTGGNAAWRKPKISIGKHLEYKFILSLEGHDVATNLKWIMSSNSIAVMPPPTYETWFMEGRLVPNYHYIQIKSDYSDVEERLNYYLQNPTEAQQIIANANEYVRQFLNKKREDILSLLVLEKYFYFTNQIKIRSI